MRIFPHLRPGFTDVPLASPAGEPSLSPLNPLIPLFRSRRFNPGFSTQFGALHGGLYAPARLTRHIRYTHPLSSSSLFLCHPPTRITYLPSAHTYTVTRPYPGSSRLLFPPHSPSFSRERRPLYSLLLHPFCPLSLPLLLLSSSVLDSLLAILSLLFSPFFSLYPSSASLSLGLSLFPLVVSLSPRATTPASSPPLIPLTLSREGTLADAPDVSTVRLPFPPLAATDANGVVTTTDVVLPSPSLATLLGSDLRFSSPCPPPFPSSRNASEGVVVVVVVVPSFAFKLD